MSVIKKYQNALLNLLINSTMILSGLIVLYHCILTIFNLDVLSPDETSYHSIITTLFILLGELVFVGVLSRMQEKFS